MPARRQTKQQRVMWEAIEQAGRPLSVEEIHAAACEHVPSLGLSTVYRALRRWEADGEIKPVAVLDQPPRYELTAIADQHHHHFHCESCDRVFDVHGCPSGLADLVPEGFTLRSHEITLTGLCDECAGHQR